MSTLTISRVNAMTPEEVLEAAKTYGTYDGRRYRSYSPSMKRLYNRYQQVRQQLRTRRSEPAVVAEKPVAGRTNGSDGLSLNEAIESLELRQVVIADTLDQLRASRDLLKGIQRV